MEEVKGLTERRNTILRLLEKGVKILDEWNTSAKGSRYKVYYISQPIAEQKI